MTQCCGANQGTLPSRILPAPRPGLPLFTPQNRPNPALPCPQVPAAKEKGAFATGGELLKSESSGNLGGPAPTPARWQDNPLGGRTSRSSSTGGAVSAAAVASSQRALAV